MGSDTPNVLLLPDGWQPDGSVINGVDLGHRLIGAGATLNVDVYQRNTVIWGPVGSGTTNLLRVYLANLVAATDAVLWLIDPEQTHTHEFLGPLFDGSADKPVFDWVAADWSAAVAATKAAADLATSREEQWAGTQHDMPPELLDAVETRQVIVIVASGDYDMGFGGGEPRTPAGKAIRDNLLTIARVGDVTTPGGLVNVNVLLQLKKLTGLGEFRRHINTYIGLAGADETDLEIAYGAVPGRDIEDFGFTGQKWTAVVGNSPQHLVGFRPYWISPDRIEQILRTHSSYMATLGDDEADQLGAPYLYRWPTAFAALSGPDRPIPVKYSRLGLPDLPGNLKYATDRQLTFALFNSSPSVQSDDQRAAATILAHGAGHKLINSQRVRDTILFVDGGQLYVRWDRCDVLAEKFDNGYASTDADWHPDAALLLRLAGRLGTGGVTEDTASLIIAALEPYDDEAELGEVGAR